jgi:hypothetical protein
MKSFIRSIPVYILAVGLVISLSSVSHAAKKRGGKGAFAGGSISAGLGVAISTADQTGINSLINAAKATTASSAGILGSATEYIGYLTFRFSNNFVALQLRPSLFTQSASGSGTDGSHSYKLDGFTFFPMVRIIPLSNDLIDFYLQGGLGYAKLDGEIRNGATNSSFSGSGFGMQMGLGAEFCFVPDHCFNVEGNYRYLPISRNIVSAGSGLPTGTSQNQPNRELEDASGNDIATTLSGVSGLLSYTYNF